MNSPYNKKFKVTQRYKGDAHDGLDLVGIDSKDIYSTVDGVVERAGWENIANKKQGFGLYIRIKQTNSTDRYYFGHLSEVKVKVGQTVKKGDVIGKEGNTGYSFGSHCHYCIRSDASKKKIKDVCKISRIPNVLGTYTDNSKAPCYLVKKSWRNTTAYRTKHITQARIYAQARGLVVYDENGKTIYSYR